MKTKHAVMAVAILAAGLSLEFQSSAQVANSNINVEILKSNDSQTPYPVLKDDLVNTGTPSLAKVLFDEFTPFGACNAAALNDGEVGAASNQQGVTFALNGQWTATFILDIAKSPNGYDISEIRSTAGWPPSRAFQKYELLVSKVSAPDKFISLGIFEVSAEGAIATQIKLTGKQNPIESNVASIKFKIMVPASIGSETAYREIDVVGAASVK